MKEDIRAQIDRLAEALADMQRGSASVNPDVQALRDVFGDSMGKHRNAGHPVFLQAYTAMIYAALEADQEQ